MARNRFALTCALRHIFLNDYGLDRLFIMKDLLCLTAYYADDNTPPEIISNQKKLEMFLSKIELIKKFDLEQDASVLDSAIEELSMINLAGMTQYVKEKAYAAGDLSLTHIEGDDDQW